MRCSNEFIVAVMGLAKGIWNIKNNSRLYQKDLRWIKQNMPIVGKENDFRRVLLLGSIDSQPWRSDGRT